MDKEIFLNHLAKLCLLICNKCIVIYYKIVGEGLLSKRSFRRLVANETKNYLFEGSSLPSGRGYTLKEKFSSSRRQRDIFDSLRLSNDNSLSVVQ